MHFFQGWLQFQPVALAYLLTLSRMCSVVLQPLTVTPLWKTILAVGLTLPHPLPVKRCTSTRLGMSLVSESSEPCDCDVSKGTPQKLFSVVALNLPQEVTEPQETPPTSSDPQAQLRHGWMLSSVRKPNGMLHDAGPKSTVPGITASFPC